MMDIGVASINKQTIVLIKVINNKVQWVFTCIITHTYEISFVEAFIENWRLFGLPVVTYGRYKPTTYQLKQKMRERDKQETSSWAMGVMGHARQLFFH